MTENLPIRSAAFYGEIRPGSPLEQLCREGFNPEQLFKKQQRLLKSDNGIQAALLAPYGEESGILFGKAYRRRWLRRHRAERVWRVATRLQTTGIPIAQPYAYFIQGQHSYLFSEVLSDSCDLRTIASDRNRLEILLQTWSLLQQLAQCLADCHNAGLCHGDFKWSNIMINTTLRRFWLVDLDAAGSSSHRRAAKDVARFVLNAEEAGLAEQAIQLFINHYAQYRHLPVAHVRTAMQPLLDKIRRRHQRQYG